MLNHSKHKAKLEKLVAKKRKKDMQIPVSKVREIENKRAEGEKKEAKRVITGPEDLQRSKGGDDTSIVLPK